MGREPNWEDFMATFRGRGMLAPLVAGSCGRVGAACEVGSAADSGQEQPIKGAAAGTEVESTAAAVAAEDDAPPAIEEVPGVALAQPSGLFDGTPFVQQPLEAPG